MDEGMLFLLLVFYTRIYQSALAVAMILAGILLFQLFYLKQRRSPSAFIPAFVILIFIFLIGVETVIHPLSENNLSSFRTSFPFYRYNLPLLISLAFLLLFVSGLLLRRNLIVLFSLVPVFYAVYYILTSAHGISAGVSFMSRSVSLTVLPLMLLVSAIFYYRNTKLTKSAPVILILFVVVMVTVNIRFSSDWKAFKRDFTSVLCHNSGFVPLEKTELLNNSCQWSWPNPELSLAWSGGCVRTIVLNDTVYRKFPIDPRRQLLLKEYLKYSAVFLHIDSTATVCR